MISVFLFLLFGFDARCSSSGIKGTVVGMDSLLFFFFHPPSVLVLPLRSRPLLCSLCSLHTWAHTPYRNSLVRCVIPCLCEYRVCVWVCACAFFISFSSKETWRQSVFQWVRASARFTFLACVRNRSAVPGSSLCRHACVHTRKLLGLKEGFEGAGGGRRCLG